MGWKRGSYNWRYKRYRSDQANILPCLSHSRYLHIPLYILVDLPLFLSISLLIIATYLFFQLSLANFHTNLVDELRKRRETGEHPPDFPKGKNEKIPIYMGCFEYQ